MKKVTLFIQKSCPYCVSAHRWMDQLFEKHPEYREVPLTVIDELKEPELADRYDYWYVPTFYVGADKRHEGAANPEIIEKVFKEAYQG